MACSLEDKTIITMLSVQIRNPGNIGVMSRNSWLNKTWWLWFWATFVKVYPLSHDSAGQLHGFGFKSSESHEMADIIVHEQSLVIDVLTLEELDIVSDENEPSTNLDSVDVEALDS